MQRRDCLDNVCDVYTFSVVTFSIYIIYYILIQVKEQWDDRKVLADLQDIHKTLKVSELKNGSSLGAKYCGAIPHWYKSNQTPHISFGGCGQLDIHS